MGGVIVLLTRGMGEGLTYGILACCCVGGLQRQIESVLTTANCVRGL